MDLKEESEGSKWGQDYRPKREMGVATHKPKNKATNKQEGLAPNEK